MARDATHVAIPSTPFMGWVSLLHLYDATMKIAVLLRKLSFVREMDLTVSRTDLNELCSKKTHELLACKA